MLQATRGGETNNKRTAKMLKPEKFAMKKWILHYKHYNDQYDNTKEEPKRR